MERINNLRAGLEYAFIDSANNSNLALKPEFIYNDNVQEKKILSSIEQALTECDDFFMSVAFITRSGIEPLLMILKDLENRNIPGRILTTDYLYFSDPKAMARLASFKNIELKMYMSEGTGKGFHTKGYVFRTDDIYRMIIGSANMTANALTINHEWNTEIISTARGQMARDIIEEFNRLWSSNESQCFDDFFEDYEAEYRRQQIIKKQRALAVSEDEISLEMYTLKPNKMQAEFVENIMSMYQSGKDKALLLSATGTGKTYASAFAVRELDPGRTLFVVHREGIAKKSEESYRMVFGSSRTYGLISGNSKEFDRDMIFSTMQMMSRPDIYEQFDRDAFQVIVLDECHHSGSESYRRIMEYFTPKLWLGMTASPDTNNYDVYSIFDHNIAYEIRLQQALEEDLLCPFHYFGITDIVIDGENFNDADGVKSFAQLVSDERVDYVMKQAEYYGYSGERVRGLIFCSRKDEAKELSEKFNARGLRTATFLGEDSQARREDIVDRLVNDERKDEQLDYILTVDIFNEGIDIPEVNQVIMLRPTQSPVIFIQQLGRGLRKYADKEFVVVLDFIGNYMNNFMIPIALSGDRNYNKDAMRRFVSEGCRVIPGCSTIHFDEISKRKIYASIDRARTNSVEIIKEAYTNLKNKLGRIPTISKFGKFGSIEVRKIFDKFGSYYSFLKKYEPDYETELSPDKVQIIEYFSKKITDFKRVQDLAFLKRLISQNRIVSTYEKYLKVEFGVTLSAAVEQSVIRNLTNEFTKESERSKYDQCVLIEPDGQGSYVLSKAFRKRLEDDTFREMVTELIDYGIDNYMKSYSNRYKDTDFELCRKYNYEDVCRLLNWKKNMNAQNIGGYFYEPVTGTLPVFINYEKAEDAIAYEDRFESPTKLIALSKHPRKVDSSDADHIFKRTESDRNNRIFLFVRKNKDDNEAKEFYFLGEMNAVGGAGGHSHGVN